MTQKPGEGLEGEVGGGKEIPSVPFVEPPAEKNKTQVILEISYSALLKSQ